ncbi:opioid growth factor receptor-like protein 1 isoform X2 [Heptranchias perlo]|uniref:opioid growth factor receptor-like protein 1 isoform X2 n=1 Tax=Heptranchias perlo TaxID=212740 RepID=UPI0035599D94
MLEEAGYDSTWAESEGEAEPPAESPKPMDKRRSQRWSAEDHQETLQRPTEKRKYYQSEPYRWRNRRAAKDLQRYRHGYPDLDDKVKDNSNINFKFYMNKMPSQPDEWTIEEAITNWKGEYELLERNHSYIQWLFPLREPGMNWHAKELTRQEIKLFKESEIAKKRLIKAYEIMLDFYGIQLVNRETGEVRRTHHWRQRFNNLNLRTHNNLRITRILKCLGEMGFGHYQSPLVKFFLTETLINEQLPRVKESVLDYFIYTVRSKSERRKLILYAQQHYRPLEDFVWGPPKGTEHRFSHILEELRKEEVQEQEMVSEEVSDEDEELSCVSSEAVKRRNQKQGRLMKRKSSDSREKSTNHAKDAEERSEYCKETRTLDAATSQEDCSGEEKSNGDGKSPVSENKSHQNGNVKKQTECDEDAVEEGRKTNTKELVQGNEVLKNCETKHKEKTEDNPEMFEIQPGVVTSEATYRKEKESKEKFLPSGEPELVTSEEDKPATVGSKIGDEATREPDEIAKPEPVTIEEDKPVTVGSKIGDEATREPDEIAKPEPVTIEEDKPVTVGSKIGDEATREPDEIAKPELVTIEDDATEEDKIRNTVIGGRKNVLTELEIHEGQNKSVSERKIQSSTADESECVEEMETQEASLASAVEDAKCPGEKNVEMEIEDVKCPGEKGTGTEEDDVEMQDAQ